MLDQGGNRPNNFQIVKTKKNAGVVEIYNQLKPSESSLNQQVKQTKTTGQLT